jgi:hypothetical protein
MNLLQELTATAETIWESSCCNNCNFPPFKGGIVRLQLQRAGKEAQPR